MRDRAFSADEVALFETLSRLLGPVLEREQVAEAATPGIRHEGDRRPL
jgi:hypothetical protein